MQIRCCRPWLPGLGHSAFAIGRVRTSRVDRRRGAVRHLCVIALWRRARVLAGACCLAGFVFAGILIDLAHRPGPRPELDTEGREPVILSGCVVQPPALSGDRERFVVELDPGARVQVTAYASEGQAPPALRYGQRVEFEAACGVRATSAIPALSISPATSPAATSIGLPPCVPAPRSPCCPASADRVSGRHHGPARDGTRSPGAAIPRQRLRNRHDAGRHDRRNLPGAEASGPSSSAIPAPITRW